MIAIDIAMLQHIRRLTVEFLRDHFMETSPLKDVAIAPCFAEIRPDISYKGTDDIYQLTLMELHMLMCTIRFRHPSERAEILASIILEAISINELSNRRSPAEEWILDEHKKLTKKHETLEFDYDCLSDKYEAIERENEQLKCDNTELQNHSAMVEKDLEKITAALQNSEKQRNYERQKSVSTLASMAELKAECTRLSNENDALYEKYGALNYKLRQMRKPAANPEINNAHELVKINKFITEENCRMQTKISELTANVESLSRLLEEEQAKYSSLSGFTSSITSKFTIFRAPGESTPGVAK